MTDIQAIQARKSRRSYLETPIDKEDIAVLFTVFEEVMRVSGLTVFLIEDGSKAFNDITKTYGMFSGVRSMVLLKGKKDDENLCEKVGYFGERIILEATKLGLGTCWIGGTFQRDCDIFKISEDEEFVCLILIGNVNSKKTTKEKFFHNIIHKANKPAESLYTADETPPQWFIDGMNAVKYAPTAVNSMKFRFKFENSKASVSIPNTSYSDMVDLGIGKLHFEIGAGGKFPLGNNVTFDRS